VITNIFVHLLVKRDKNIENTTTLFEIS